MNKNILLVIFLMISFHGISQNVVYSYTSDFAKLQSELSKEFGRENTRTINYSSLTKNSKPYSLQIIGASSYNSFIKSENLYSNIRILYIDNIDFSKVNTMVFDKLSKLEAIRFKNSKNINFEELEINLSKSKNLKQIHFNKIKFKNCDFNFDKLSKLKVLTFDDCRLKEFRKMSLNLDEFSISNSKNKLNLSNLFITSVKKVIIENCIIDTFPYSLSTSKDLEYLDLTSSKIKTSINNSITGFKNLLYLDITDAKINFKSVRFIDRNKQLLIIRGSDVSQD